jgi:hypothetical protein
MKEPLILKLVHTMMVESKVYVKDRAVMDVCRSIAHELVHHKHLENRISDHINDGGDVVK